MTFRTEDRASGPTWRHGQVSLLHLGDADYHDLLRDRMRPLSDALHAARPGCRTRLAVDTRGPCWSGISPVGADWAGSGRTRCS